jgi:hypothetical protein
MSPLLWQKIAPGLSAGRVQVLSHIMHLLISLRKSTPPQNRQLYILIRLGSK